LSQVFEKVKKRLPRRREEREEGNRLKFFCLRVSFASFAFAVTVLSFDLSLRLASSTLPHKAFNRLLKNERAG
jgi:hypothetical protein